ncbi:hypothetical protein BDV98DRAFT_591147 [Pterulicium gracile]|uniref:Uncharacterized protein n=1 Tax=Pterulicium gracile TaxID=1884261 RepID=A0A5C3QMU5_9AGAR|nr:hypothetical protein BDV98DRAFT_591147 [Pterula gracilis]
MTGQVPEIFSAGGLRPESPSRSEEYPVSDTTRTLSNTHFKLTITLLSPALLLGNVAIAALNHNALVNTQELGTNNSSALVKRADFFAEGTVFDVSVGFTACGQLHNNGEFVVAVSHALYDSPAVDGNPNHNTICGKQMWLWGFFQAAPVQVTGEYQLRVFIPAIVNSLVHVDSSNFSRPLLTFAISCGGCEGKYDIDMLESLFTHVTRGQTTGRCAIGWQPIGWAPNI